MTKITPVLMSGGAGTRLWPLSRRGRPKQFHTLGGERTLIQDTALRVTGDLFGAPIVVANVAHETLVREQLDAVGVTPRAILLEPVGRNTGPAAAAVAAYVAREDPEALIMLLHADNRVHDVLAFRTAVAAGIPSAAAGSFVIFGIRPTEPSTSYGYIRAGASAGAARQVAAFIEKPDLATAQAYLADPAYSWNAGMFLFGAGFFLAEVRRLAPDIANAAEAAVETAKVSGLAVALGDAFRTAPSEAIDTAIFEKTSRAVVVDADIGWSDVGAWQALWSDAVRDADGNAVERAVTAGASGCLVISDGPTVVLAGVENLAVIVDNGVVLVARREGPDAMRAAVAALRSAGREDLL